MLTSGVSRFKVTCMSHNYIWSDPDPHTQLAIGHFHLLNPAHNFLLWPTLAQITEGKKKILENIVLRLVGKVESYQVSFLAILQFTCILYWLHISFKIMLLHNMIQLSLYNWKHTIFVNTFTKSLHLSLLDTHSYLG